jgi:hypothetical protein
MVFYGKYLLLDGGNQVFSVDVFFFFRGHE